MFIAEIKLYAGIKCPNDFLPCDGRYVNIDDYPVLYAALSDMYGPIVDNTFKLPDLRSRLPIGIGSGGNFTARTLGENVGTEESILTVDNLPSHNHEMLVSLATANQDIFENMMIGDGYHFLNPSSSANRIANMSDTTIGNIGNGLGHNNIMPVIALNYIIRCNGDYVT
jgi:microcystin-dependent protein